MSIEPLVVIPARLASSRLPGKPLKKIGSKTLIRHCVDSCRKAGFEPVVLSDSERVMEAAYCVSYLTSEEVETGTDRVAEYIDKYWGWDNAPEWIINVQGDMPFGTAPFIRALIDATKEPNPGAITVEAYDPCVRCERPLDWRSEKSFRRWDIYRHVGMYAYHKDVLRTFYEYGPQVDERKLALEQLRFRHIDVWVDVVTVDALPPLEVNTQADLDRINEIVNACAGFSHPGFTDDEAASLALAGGG